MSSTPGHSHRKSITGKFETQARFRPHLTIKHLPGRYNYLTTWLMGYSYTEHPVAHSSRVAAAGRYPEFSRDAPGIFKEDYLP